MITKADVFFTDLQFNAKIFGQLIDRQLIYNCFDKQFF